MFTSLSKKRLGEKGSKNIKAGSKKSVKQRHSEKRTPEQDLLLALLKSSSDHIYFKDLKSRFIKVSAALAQRHGLTAKQIIGKTDFDIFGPIHAKQAFEDEQQIIKTGIPIIGKEEFEDSQDGRITWVTTSKMPLYNSDGKIIGTYGISRDITRRKRAESIREALFQISEAVYRAADIYSLCEKIHEVIAKLMPAKNFYIALNDEKNGKITFPYYSDEHGAYKSTREIGQGLVEYVLKTGKSELIDSDRIALLMKNGEIDSVEMVAALWLGVPLITSEKIIGVVVIQDYENPNSFKQEEIQILNFVAEQIAQALQIRISEEEIKKYTEELKLLNQTKDKLFSIISHDLRSPLSGLLAFSEVLLEDFASQSDEEKELFVVNLQSSMRNLLLLTENILSWAKLQSAGIKATPQKIKLVELINSVIVMKQLNAVNKGINLSCSCDPELMIYADINMIDTVIRNLISNSIKFTHSGGAIEVSSKLIGTNVVISVEDNGIGMNEELMSNLFKFDKKVSREGTQHEKGSGLGLGICKEFVELNGGTISIKSEINQGTCISFTIPIFSSMN